MFIADKGKWGRVLFGGISTVIKKIKNLVDLIKNVEYFLIVFCTLFLYPCSGYNDFSQIYQYFASFNIKITLYSS